MCFYCHKLYFFPYAPSHGHETCPELDKINKLKQTKQIVSKYTNKEKPLDPNPTTNVQTPITTNTTQMLI